MLRFQYKCLVDLLLLVLQQHYCCSLHFTYY